MNEHLKKSLPIGKTKLKRDEGQIDEGRNKKQFEKPIDDSKLDDI